MNGSVQSKNRGARRSGIVLPLPSDRPDLAYDRERTPKKAGLPSLEMTGAEEDFKRAKCAVVHACSVLRSFPSGASPGSGMTSYAALLAITMWPSKGYQDG